jgi:3',5'-cyclic-AMP phosphodiesterase
MKSVVSYLFFVLLFFSSVNCKKVFEFSPYEISLDERYKNTTAKNLQRLHEVNQHFNDTVFTIGLLSDPHYFYDDLQAAVDYINSQKEIDFVLIAGDLTDGGLKEEYILMYEKLNSLDIPWFTVIGNHDYLSDGEIIYDQMFGPRNYSFSFAGTKIILFDDVFWESEKTPDFNWLQNQFNDRHQYKKVIVCNHIPWRTDQFDNASSTMYASMMTSNNVSYNINGHQHVYETGFISGDQVPFVFVPTVKVRKLVTLSVGPSSIRLDTSNF